jgi:hypothetical protein
MLTLSVEGRTFGRKAELFPGFAVSLPPEWAEEGTAPTLRNIIERIVAQQVIAFKERRAQRSMVQCLTAAQIADGATKGRILPGLGEEASGDVDEDAAIAVALQAFVDGLYFVFVDDVQRERLDEYVPLTSDSAVTFLRLVALAGG